MKQLLFGLLCGMRSRLPKGMLVQVSNTDLKESTNIWLIILVEIHLNAGAFDTMGQLGRVGQPHRDTAKSGEEPRR